MCNVVFQQLVTRPFSAVLRSSEPTRSRDFHVPLLGRLATLAGNFAISISECNCTSSPIDISEPASRKSKPDESPHQTDAQERRTMVSRRACDAPLPEGVKEATTSADGCNICSNKGRYGRGTSVCGQCGRCHGCGSSNNGIGPLQATYFGLRSVVRKVDGQLRGDGDKDKEQQKDGKTVAGSTS